eukprot:SAG22_NODE_148_length_17459_cov_18.266359_3_plen_173_part_00
MFNTTYRKTIPPSGTFHSQMNLTVAGAYSIAVYLGNRLVQMAQIPDSPFAVQVYPAVPDAKNSVLVGQDALARQCATESSSGIPGCGAPADTPLSFAVTINDRFGNPRLHGVVPSDSDRVSLIAMPPSSGDVISSPTAVWDVTTHMYALMLTGKEVYTVHFFASAFVATVSV